jgi:hypothetical protein
LHERYREKEKNRERQKYRAKEKNRERQKYRAKERNTDKGKEKNVNLQTKGKERFVKKKIKTNKK